MNTSQIFYETAREFCLWAESGSNYPEIELVTALRLLSKLYSQALMLKISDSEIHHEAISISNEQWQSIFRRFGSLPFSYYPEVDDITNIETPTTSLGDIADDLADTYRDLKAGIYLYDLGYALEAVNEWKSHFNYHWGLHAVNAMNALHAYANLKNIAI